MKSSTIFGVLTFAVVFFLALMPVQDTDAWMHLNIGRLIWTQTAIPETESFVYTAEGEPFVYTSWLFSVILYGISIYTSYSGLVILKSLIIGIAFLVLFRDIVEFRNRPAVALFFVILCALLGRGRFVVRPDIFMALFFALSIYLTNRFIRTNSKTVLFLPLIHLLWANTHSSAVLYLVPYFAVIGVGTALRVSSRFGLTCDGTPSTRQIGTLSALLVISSIAVQINPNGYRQIFFGQNVLQTEIFKEQIVELLPSTIIGEGIAIIITAIILFFFLIWIAARIFGAAERRGTDMSTLVGWLMICPFLIMMWQANRFYFPLLIVAAPTLARGWVESETLVRNILGRRSPRPPQLVALCAVLLVVTAGIVARGIADQKRFGIGRDLANVPEGALQFMDQHDITGRVLNTFEWGGYIAWRDAEARSVSVDPRGNIKPEILEQIFNVERAFSGLEELHRTYGFESALLKYSIYGNPIQWEAYDRARSASNWALVYWDDLSLLYVRRDGPHAEVAENFSYDYAIPVGGFEAVRRLIDIGRLDTVERELMRNSESTGSALSKLLLGQALAQAGRFEEATKHLEDAAARDYERVKYAYHASIGYVYQRQGRSAEAAAAYETVLAGFRDARTMENLASIYQHQGKEKQAIALLEEILEEDPHNYSVVSKLALLHARQGNTAKAEHYRNRTAALDESSRAKEDFERGMKAYVRKDFEEALRYLNAALQSLPNSPEILSNIGYIWFDRGDYQQALVFHQSSIAADPSHANGYYGAAQAYKALGNVEQARKHWEKYVELVPRGPFVRRAREELRRLE